MTLRGSINTKGIPRENVGCVALAGILPECNRRIVNHNTIPRQQGWLYANGVGTPPNKVRLESVRLVKLVLNYPRKILLWCAQ